jgi:hypothetical protein
LPLQLLAQALVLQLVVLPPPQALVMVEND